MNNRTIARYLRVLASMLEVQQPHDPLAKRYRQAADAIRALQDDVAAAPDTLPAGIHRSIFPVIQQLLEHGLDAAFQTASLSIPFSLREILELPGIGPHTTHTLYHTYGIAAIDDLEEALAHHRELPVSDTLRSQLPQEIRALRERKRRIPLRTVEAAAADILSELAAIQAVLEAAVSGSVRRRDPLSDHLLVLARVSDDVRTQAEQALYDRDYTAVPASRCLDGTAIKVLNLTNAYFCEIWKEERAIPVYVLLIAPEAWAQAMVYGSGDATHNEALYNLTTNGQTTKPNVQPSEEAVYEAAGLPYISALLRHGRSMTKDPKSLVDLTDIKGDLHMHTTYSDGHDTIEDMVQACVSRGYSYMTISDHSQGLTIARGLSYDRLMRQHEEMLRMREKYPQITLFHGSEVDITADAKLDFADSILRQLDFVVASIHTAMRQTEAELTARALYAIESPYVHILAHPTGRMLGRRDSFPLHFDKVFEAAKEHHVAVECNSNPDRLDLDPQLLQRAMEAGCLFSIDSDAHSVENLTRIEDYGIDMAKKGWLTPDRVINTWPLERLLAWMKKGR